MPDDRLARLAAARAAQRPAAPPPAPPPAATPPAAVPAPQVFSPALGSPVPPGFQAAFAPQSGNPAFQPQPSPVPQPAVATPPTQVVSHPWQGKPEHGGAKVMTSGGTQVRVTENGGMATGVEPTARGSVRAATAPSVVRVTGGEAVRPQAAIPGQAPYRIIEGASQSGVARVVGDHRSSGVARVVGQPGVPQMQPQPMQPQPMQPQPVVAPAPRPNVPEVDLTIVLGVHARPRYLSAQLDALDASSVQSRDRVLWVTPAPGVAVDEGAIARVSNAVRVPSMQPGREGPFFVRDKGAWARLWLASSATTRFVLIMDDDAIVGPTWIEAAMRRCAELSAQNIPAVIAAGGTLYQSDDANSGMPVGPEASRPQETDVDIGRGAWLCETAIAHMAWMLPRFDARGWAFALALAVQIAGDQAETLGRTIVLPYEATRSGWGLLTPPTTEASLSTRIAQIADLNVLNAQRYAAYRRGVPDAPQPLPGWVPLCVLDQLADAAKLVEDTEKPSVEGAAE